MRLLVLVYCIVHHDVPQSLEYCVMLCCFQFSTTQNL